MSEQAQGSSRTLSRPAFERRLIRLFLAAQEVDAGVRPPEHLSRWVSEAVLLKMRVRAELTRQQRRIHRRSPILPDVHILRTLVRPTYDLLRIDCVIVFTKDRIRTQVAAVVFTRHCDRWLIDELAVL